MGFLGAASGVLGQVSILRKLVESLMEGPVNGLLARLRGDFGGLSLPFKGDAHSLSQRLAGDSDTLVLSLDMGEREIDMLTEKEFVRRKGLLPRFVGDLGTESRLFSANRFGLSGKSAIFVLEEEQMASACDPPLAPFKTLASFCFWFCFCTRKSSIVLEWLSPLLLLES